MKTPNQSSLYPLSLPALAVLNWTLDFGNNELVVLVLVLLCQVTSPHMASASTTVTEPAPAPAGATNKVRRNIGDYR